MDNERNGRVILKAIPTQLAREKVAGYLKKIAKNTAYDKIVEGIAHCPSILFKSVSEETGKKIAAELIELGAFAAFEPFATTSKDAPKTQQDLIPRDQIPSDTILENQNPSSKAGFNTQRSRIPRRSVMAISLGLLSCLLVLILYLKQSHSLPKASHQNAIAKKSDRRSVAITGQEDPEMRDSEKIASTEGSAVIAGGKKTAVEKNNATRVGVYIFSAYRPGLCDLPFAKGITKSLAETYKNDPDLKILEREKIDQIIVTRSLSVKQMLDPEEAAKVGRQIGADILIVGQLIDPDEGNDQDEIRAVAVKAIHIPSAKTIDIGCYQHNKAMYYSEWMNRVAKFVKTSTTSNPSLGQREFVVVDQFVDRSAQKNPENQEAKLQKFLYGESGNREHGSVIRHPGLARYMAHYKAETKAGKLRKFLFREFGNRKHVCVISQRYLRHFFDTLFLNENGFTPDNDMIPSAQPAYTLLSGDITFDPKADMQFALELKVEFLGQSHQNLAIEGKSWDEGLKNLSNELDVLLLAGPDLEEQKRVRAKRKYDCEEGRICEARAHFLRGKELSNIIYMFESPALNVTCYADGQAFETAELGEPLGPDGRRKELSPERRLQNVRQAINEFESALFLDPDYNEAKLFLAVCLSHPAIGESKRSTDLLREVVSNSAEDRLKFNAAKALGIAETVDFSPSFVEKYLTPEYFARTYRANSHKLLDKDGKQGDWWDQDPDKVNYALKAVNKSILAHCENVIWRSEGKVDWKVKNAVNEACSAFTDITWEISKNEIIDNYFRELMSTLRQKYPQLVPNLIAHCYRRSEPILREEYLITLKRIEAGDTKPIVPNLFYKELYGSFIGGAISENKEYQEVGIHIANILDRHSPLSYYDKLHLACCYKGVGEIEKALDLLEQVDGANSPGMKKAFLENSCKAFRKKFVEELAKKQTSKQEQTKIQPKRSIPSVVKVPKDRIIHAIAQDGDTLWICANLRQDPNAPSGIYDPVIYRYRVATDQRTSLKLPERIKCMATSIIARNNTIWVGTDEGLLEIVPDRNIFRHLKEDDGLLKPNVNSLTLSNNKLYIGLGSGAGYLDINKHHFTGLITTNDVVRIASSPKAIWVITKGNGLICFSEKSDEKEFQSVWNCADSFSLAANHRYVVIGKNLQVGRYFGMRNVGAGGLVVYDLKLNRKYSISGLEHFRSADVLSLAFTGDLLWVGGRGFLAVVDLQGHKIADEIYGRGTAFFALLADNNDGMWVAQGHKLYHLAYGQNGFEKR